MRDVLLRLGLPRASLPQYAGDGVPGACAGLSSDGGVLVDVLVSAQQEEPPEHVLGSRQPEKPPQQVLPHPQAEAPLEDLLAPSQTLESLVTVLASPPPEEPRRLCLLALRRRRRVQRLEGLLSRPQLVESLVRVLVSFPPEEPQEQVLPHLQTEAPLEDLLAPSQTLESLVTVLASPLRQRSHGDYACSRSDGGVAGDSVCCDVARRSPESFCGGGALGDRGAASPEAALHDFVSFPLYCLYSSLPFTGLGRNGGLFFYTMHLMFYTVPYIVQLLTLLAWLLLAFCCRFATELWPPSVDLSKKFFHRGCYARSLQ